MTDLLELEDSGFVSDYKYRRYHKILGNVTLLNTLRAR